MEILIEKNYVEESDMCYHDTCDCDSFCRDYCDDFPDD